MATDWNDTRAVAFSPMAPPAEWPPNARPISTEGVSLFGIDPATNSSIGTASKLCYAIVSSRWEASNVFLSRLQPLGSAVFL